MLKMFCSIKTMNLPEIRVVGFLGEVYNHTSLTSLAQLVLIWMFECVVDHPSSKTLAMLMAEWCLSWWRVASFHTLVWTFSTDSCAGQSLIKWHAGVGGRLCWFQGGSAAQPLLLQDWEHTPASSGKSLLPSFMSYPFFLRLHIPLHRWLCFAVRAWCEFSHSLMEARGRVGNRDIAFEPSPVYPVSPGVGPWGGC